MPKQKAQPVHNNLIKDLPELYNGRIKVACDGKVYRNTNGKWALAPQCKTSRNGAYRAVSIFENGKQRTLYVHRLVAEAYIPNPDKKPEVNHIDGNGSNNHVDNLEWTTHKENVAHAHQSGLVPTLKTAGTPCIYCGEPTLNKDRVCPQCRIAFKIEARRLAEVEDRAALVEAAIDSMDVIGASSKHVDMLLLYSKGLTFQDIATKYNLSRERVRQIIDRLIAPYSREYQKHKRITPQQREIAGYISQMGFNRTHLARQIMIDKGRLYRMLSLSLHMPADVFDSLSEATKFNQSRSQIIQMIGAR